MTRSTLLYIRFFVPAVIFVVLTYALAKVLKVPSQDVPISVNDLGYNLSYLVIAAIYQYLPIRNWFYAPFRADIDKRIRLRLVAISGIPDDPLKFEWKRVANVFYSLVDNDKSLEKRSEDVMFNGALMTSFADLSAITSLFLLGTLAAWGLGYPTGRAAALLSGLVLVSILMQELARRRHIKLGENQLDYIEQQKRADVVAQMKALNA